MRMRRSTRRLMLTSSVLLAGILTLAILNSNATNTSTAAEAKVSAAEQISNANISALNTAEKGVESKKLSLAQFTKDAEDQREKALAEKAEAEDLAKKKLQKEQSNECLFWKQQKKLGKAANADAKIAKFCVL
jgi:hypothetical protein